MANIKLNFSSQWPSIQVAMVIPIPHTRGDAVDSPYVKKIKHNLKYPPLAIGFRDGVGSFAVASPMEGIDVDDKYIYIRDFAKYGDITLSCAIVYAIDISTAFNYSNYTSETGEVIEDKSGGHLDLRKFLLHSRAVSPMVLSVTTKTFTSSDTTLTYTHPLNYPTFNFGYVLSQDGIWKNAPLASQAVPWLQTNGYTSILDGASFYTKASIITLRNPAIITIGS
jgi:hypothetical protein